MLIRDIRKKKNYRFDENGFFETNDSKLIRRMTAKFEIASEGKSSAMQPEREFVCSKCGRICKNALGLASHEKACKGV